MGVIPDVTTFFDTQDCEAKNPTAIFLFYLKLKKSNLMYKEEKRTVRKTTRKGL
jgi:hypothetical protein